MSSQNWKLKNSAGTDPVKAFILKGFGIVREQAPLSIDISLLPDLVEKLPGVGFIEERPFGIISTVMKFTRSNRRENSLAVFDFDESTGMLAFKSRTMLKGDWPRDFIFATDIALVACERSGEVLGLNYDRDAGTFKTVATLGGLFRPASLLERVVS